MATAVTNSNIFSQAWTEIYNLINTGLGSNVKGIYAQWPDKPLSKKNDYPIVIIERASLNDDEMLSFDLRDASLSCDIEVYSTSNSGVDTLSDSIFSTLRTNTDELEGGSKLKILSISNSTDDDFERGGIKVHMRAITITFKVFGGVS